MTETEWQAGRFDIPSLIRTREAFDVLVRIRSREWWDENPVTPALTDRKCRLIAVALMRRLLGTPSGSGWLLDRVEEEADRTRPGARQALKGLRKYARRVAARRPSDGAAVVADLSTVTKRTAVQAALHTAAQCGQADPGDNDWGVILQDILGNPFRPVIVDPAWRTATVIALGTAIYEQRAFDRMPVLADALEEAGCDNVDVLLHCRGDGPHVRGCWVVDLVLGKE